MTDDSYFHDPDLPWMPKLIDIEMFKQQTDIPEKAEYFSKFGWNQIDYGSYEEQDGELVYVGDYPHIADRWETLTQRFNQRYYYRMLGIETMEHWQNNLQERFDAVANRYELAYTLFEEHGAKIVEDVIAGETETVSGSNQASGSDSNTSSSLNKNWDTPDSAINAQASYADSVSSGSGSGSVTYGKKDTYGSTRTKLITGEGILKSINTTIRDFQDIDTMFINEFSDLFLSVYWY